MRRLVSATGDGACCVRASVEVRGVGLGQALAELVDPGAGGEDPASATDGPEVPVYGPASPADRSRPLGSGSRRPAASHSAMSMWYAYRLASVPYGPSQQSRRLPVAAPESVTIAWL